MKVVHVAVGVIKQDQHIYITRRADHLHQGGKWEFPGGKVEQGETIAQAIVRELAEEVGIRVTTQQPLMEVEFSYPDKQVHLHVHMVDGFDGEPYGKEGQDGQWVAIADLHQYDFPDANDVIVSRLQTNMK